MTRVLEGGRWRYRKMTGTENVRRGTTPLTFEKKHKTVQDRIKRGKE